MPGISKKTIGIVLSMAPKYSETFFRNKIRGLENNGFEVILFVGYDDNTSSESPYHVVVAPDVSLSSLKGFFNLKIALFKTFFVHPGRSFRLWRLNRRDGLSIKQTIKSLIHNEFILAKKLDWLHFGFGILASNRENIAAAMGANMGVSFRGYDLYLSPLIRQNCYDLLFSKDVKYHVLSQEMKQDIKDYGVPANNVVVIPPAIDTAFFSSESNNSKNTKLELLTVARLHWKKGLEYSLEAMKLLKDRGVDFRYTIIGEGNQKERLLFAAHQLGISEEINFTGKLTQEAIKTYLERSDIYLQYSIQEGFCNAVLEAQAMGLMCIVSNAEGLSENVLNNRSGWVVPKRSPENLADKIVEVSKLSPTEKQRISDFAIKRVRSEFNLEQQNQAFFNFYNLDQHNDMNSVIT